ncbi:MAG TPA: NAD(P)H-dependent glycerol-3-phosphate dehydrogenase [Hyphomicrobium sp.]|nr:NAD(P)H-dependent glycerol-3-phosphate dehydrogenase [Hyphomicrobium sp.]
MKIDSVGIIGGGAWGTALALSLRRSGRDVVLWAREPEVVAGINERHLNAAFLPGVALDPAIRATGKLAELARSDALMLVAPAQHVRAVSQQLKPHLRKGQPIVLCAKGIEQQSGRLMGEVLDETVPEAPRAVLSGPSFAADVARGLPTALTIACANEPMGRVLAERLGNRSLRLYWTSDLVGVELGGALKNVLAIAAGIVDGKGLGASAHAALVTRGFAELRRFGEALGARPETLTGLSGLGDLILTCGSAQSRNMSLGRALGQGQSLAQALGGRTAVTEGVYTAVAVRRIAAEKGIEMPICSAVCDIVEGRISVADAIGRLMQRPLKPED